MEAEVIQQQTVWRHQKIDVFIVKNPAVRILEVKNDNQEVARGIHVHDTFQVIEVRLTRTIGKIIVITDPVLEAEETLDHLIDIGTVQILIIGSHTVVTEVVLQGRETDVIEIIQIQGIEAIQIQGIGAIQEKDMWKEEIRAPESDSKK